MEPIQLQHAEAMAFRDLGETTLLFEIGSVRTAEKDKPFDAARGEPVFPAVLSRSEAQDLVDADRIHSSSRSGTDTRGYVFCTGAVVFWRFVGDATHHSEPVTVPHRLFLGRDDVLLEQRYNLPPTYVTVSAIKLVRWQGGPWLWSVTFKRGG